MTKEQARILIDAYEIYNLLANEEEINCLREANPALLDACEALVKFAK